MVRRAAFVLMALFMALAPASAREACEGYSVETFVDRVPALAQRMVRAPGQPEGTVRFVHPDDARISVAFGLQAAAPGAPVTRADYAKDILQRLNASIPPASAAAYKATVNPFDPVSWALQSRTPVGENVETRGQMTVRVAPTCHLVIAWQVYESAILASRITELNAAIEAVRALSVKDMAPAGFLPDSNVPMGRKSVLLGVGLPFLAALILAATLKSMLFYGRPGGQARAVMAVTAAMTALGVLVQAPHYAEGLADLRFTDNGILLSSLSLLLLGAGLTGSARLSLASATLSLSTSVALVVGAAYGWSPDTGVCLFIALALMVCAGSVLWFWHGAVARAGRRQASHA